MNIKTDFLKAVIDSKFEAQNNVSSFTLEFWLKMLAVPPGGWNLMQTEFTYACGTYE